MSRSLSEENLAEFEKNKEEEEEEVVRSEGEEEEGEEGQVKKRLEEMKALKKSSIETEDKTELNNGASDLRENGCTSKDEESSRNDGRPANTEPTSPPPSSPSRASPLSPDSLAGIYSLRIT